MADVKHFPVPPRVLGYLPRELTVPEQILELDCEFGKRERVKFIVAYGIRISAESQRRMQTTIDRLTQDARDLVDRCFNRRYSPFAIVEEIRQFRINNGLDWA